MKIYPAIDLMDGHCVRLYQGRFDMKTEYSDDPVAIARDFAAEGARFLHVVDLDGARAGERRQSELIGRIAKESGLGVQAGGGIRTLEDALSLRAVGVERIVLGSLIVSAPGLTNEIVGTLDPQHVTLALDIRHDPNGVPRLASHGWQTSTGQSLWETLEAMADDKVQVLCTDISTDGTLQGPNFSLYAEIVERFPGLSLIASGGIGSLDDLRKLARQKVAGVVVGKALYDRKFTLAEALSC
jgi:phosphoribosylformimino-5-aminoimidazole carboxamide ribotide isomerase